MNDQQLEIPSTTAKKESGPVECLGRTFANDAERRGYFIDRLRERLADPELRRTPGCAGGLPVVQDPPLKVLSPSHKKADGPGATHGKQRLQ